MCDKANEVREQIHLKNEEVESFQEGSEQWQHEEHLRPSWLWIALYNETKLSSPDWVKVVGQHTDLLINRQ